MHVACACGKMLKVADAVAGKRIRCPVCRTIVPAGEPDTVTTVVPVDAPPSRSNPARQDETPKKAKRARARTQPDEQGGAAVLWIGAALLAVLLACGAGLAYYLKREIDKPAQDTQPVASRPAESGKTPVPPGDNFLQPPGGQLPPNGNFQLPPGAQLPPGVQLPPGFRMPPGGRQPPRPPMQPVKQPAKPPTRPVEKSPVAVQLRDRLVAELVRELKGGEPQARAQAARRLGERGPGAAAAVPALIEALDDAEVLPAAAQALGAIGPAAKAALPKLRKHLDDAGPGLRAILRSAMEKIE